MGDDGSLFVGVHNTHKATNPKYTKTGQSYISGDERKKKRKAQKKARKNNR